MKRAWEDNVATDEAIEQRLGKDPNDEDVKDGSNANTPSCSRSCVPSSQTPGPVRLPPRHPLYQPIHRPERGPALRLLRHAPHHGGRARPAARPLRLPPALPRRRQGRDGPQRQPESDRRDGRHRLGLHRRAVPHHRPRLHHPAAIAVARFPTARKLCAWAGLTPQVRNSDRKVRRGHITKQGSPWVRGILQEAAQTAKRHPMFAAADAQLARRRGRNIATVAIARRLLARSFHILSQLEAAPAPEKASTGRARVSHEPATRPLT
jgi:hypothetical protein